MGMARELAVPLPELPGDLRCSKPFQIHGQECDVGQNVAVTQLVIELYAVQNTRAVVEQKDVLRQQTAVAVAHHAVRHSVLEQRQTALQVASRQALCCGRESPAQHRAHVGRHLLKVVLPVAAHSFNSGRRRDCGRGGCPFMEARDQARELTHAVGDTYAAADQRRQPLSCRHAPHDHQVVAGAAVGPLNVGNTQVDVRRQPSVQLNFSPAGCLAGLAC